MSSNYNYSMFHQNRVKHFLYLHVLLKAICYHNTLENREKTGFPLSSTTNLTRINTVKPYLSIRCSRRQRTCRILKQASLTVVFLDIPKEIFGSNYQSNICNYCPFGSLVEVLLVHPLLCKFILFCI